MTLDEYIQKNCQAGQYGDQDRNGVDLSLIRETLRLSPVERLGKADRATTDALTIRKQCRRIT